MDLSVAAQLRALREHADKNGYVVVREFVDEAESGRVADRPQFQEMLDEAKKTQAPFREILVWKFSRFTRKREHAVAFKSMLRRRGIRVVSITEQADDTAVGRLLEGIIETIDEFYSDNLAQDVTRGMREAASRGFWMSSEAPLGYNRLMVQDGPKKRPKLEPDSDSSRVVRRMFDMSEAGKSTLDIARILNDEGITSPRGKPWGKTSVHAILINETYTGALIWGVNAKDGADPVRVENAFPAIISKAQFNRVTKLLRSRAPKIVNPRRVASPFLLSGLVRCKTCGRALTGQGSKYAQFTYYVCQTLMKQGKGSCDAPRLNARRFEDLVVGRIRSNIFTEGNVPDLVKAVDEEIDGMVAEHRKRVQTIEAEIQDVNKQLDPHLALHSHQRRRRRGQDLGPHGGVPGPTGASRGRGGDRERGAGPEQVSSGRRRQNCGIRQTDGRLPGQERTDRAQGVHRVVRQGDRGNARPGPPPLHIPDAGRQPDTR